MTGGIGNGFVEHGFVASANSWFCKNTDFANLPNSMFYGFRGFAISAILDFAISMISLLLRIHSFVKIRILSIHSFAKQGFPIPCFTISVVLPFLRIHGFVKTRILPIPCAEAFSAGNPKSGKSTNPAAELTGYQTHRI